MNTYFIFDSKLLSFKGGNVQAKWLNPFNWDMSVKWHHPPLNHMKIEIDFKFEVNLNFPHPNNYWTGAGVYLFDAKLIELMRLNKVEFEEFNADLYCKKSQSSCLEEKCYKVFRPMYTCPLIDVERSVYTEKLSFEKIVLNENANKNHPLLVDLNFPHIHFVSQEVREQIEDSGITGCKFLSLEEYARQTTWR